MTKSVAVQHAKDNIHANSVHPGIVPPMRTSGRTADPAVRAERMRVIPIEEWEKGIARPIGKAAGSDGRF